MSSIPSNKKEIEKEIVALLQEGDEKAISIIYQNYGEVLYGFIRRIISSEELAQEVLQDTFVKIWKNAGQYNASKGRLFTWFVNIARNTAIDKVRSADFQRQERTGSIENIVNNSELGTEEQTTKDSGLLKIINSLDEKHRVLIDLVYFQGYSQREIEKKLEIPLGTVKSRIRTAINELRTKLDSDFARNLMIVAIISSLYILLL